MSHKADGGVEIGRSGAADVNLHEGPQRGNGRATAAGAAGRPNWRIPRFGVEPAGRIGSIRFTRGAIAPRHRAPL
jgi:hypothetical protein